MYVENTAAAALILFYFSNESEFLFYPPTSRTPFNQRAARYPWPPSTTGRGGARDARRDGDVVRGSKLIISKVIAAAV